MTELNVDQAVAIAIALHREGHLSDAKKLYRRVLSVEPKHPDVMHFLGLLMHQVGEEAEALRMMRYSVEARPDVADFRLNLGNVLLEQDRLVEAEEVYRSALALNPQSPQLYNNLAVVLRGLNRLGDSEASYRQAITVEPTFAEAHHNLGRLLSAGGRVAEAIVCFATALTLRPGSARTREHLVRAYDLLGQVEEARAALRDWLREEPESPVAQHLAAAYREGDVPERASDRFVETIFDRFAASFDSTLEALDYRAPDLVAEALTRAMGSEAVADEALDAGCGTGLCGLAIAPFVGRLTGVDLSESMLDRARRRGLYADLHREELSHYLDGRRDAFNAIVSADTLVYFGALEQVFAAAAGALQPTGFLVFTLEAHEDGPDYRLNTHGRYSHRADYVVRALNRAGLTVLALDFCTPRREAGQPVPGLVVTAKKN